MSLLTSAATGLVSRAEEADLDGVFGNDPLWVVLLKAVLIFVVLVLLTLFNIWWLLRRLRDLMFPTN
jgi:NADH-quinone oxidoreductase subunit H